MFNEYPPSLKSGAFVPHSAINLSVKANEAAAAAAAAAAQSASGIASSSLDLTVSGEQLCHKQFSISLQYFRCDSSSDHLP